MIRCFYDIDGDTVMFRSDRRMVGQELYVILTPAAEKPESFEAVVHAVCEAVSAHLSMHPQDKYLARFVVGEDIGTDDERYYEVQFRDRDALRYPTWQQMICSPYLNSRDAA